MAVRKGTLFLNRGESTLILIMQLPQDSTGHGSSCAGHTAQHQHLLQLTAAAGTVSIPLQ